MYDETRDMMEDFLWLVLVGTAMVISLLFVVGILWLFKG